VSGKNLFPMSVYFIISTVIVPTHSAHSIRAIANPWVQREQIKARLDSFEHTATNSIEEQAIDSLEGPEATSLEVPASTTYQTKKIQTSVRKTRSQRKRNHDQIDLDGPSSNVDQLELLIKRKRSRNVPISTESSTTVDNNSVVPGQQAKAKSRMVIEIISSNRAPRSR